MSQTSHPKWLKKVRAWIAKKLKPKKPRKCRKKMDAFILSRETLTGYLVIGAYTTLALAEAARDTKIQTFVDAQNAQRDVDYAAGIAFDALLTPADVLPLARITQLIVNK